MHITRQMLNSSVSFRPILQPIESEEFMNLELRNKPAADLKSIPILQFIYFNARSVRSKLTDLHSLLYSKEGHLVVCITETWLSSEVTSGLLDPESKYSIYRTDRDRSFASGGVCILVDKRLNSSTINVNGGGQFNTVEIVACRIKLETLVLNLSCIYFAPNLSLEMFANGINCLSTLYSNDALHLTVGDFNLPNIDWSTLTSPIDMKCSLLLDLCQSSALCQLVSEPTRENNILDLVLTNDLQLISSLVVVEPFSTSDHNAILFKICSSATPSVLSSHCDEFINYVNWNGGHWDEFAAYCDSMDWVLLLSTAHTADECWKVFTDIVNAEIDRFIPKVCRRKGMKPKIDPALKKLNNKKRSLWKLNKVSPTKTSSDRYKLAAKAVRSFILAKSISVEHDIIMSHDSNKFF